MEFAFEVKMVDKGVRQQQAAAKAARSIGLAASIARHPDARQSLRNVAQQGENVGNSAYRKAIKAAGKVLKHRKPDIRPRQLHNGDFGYCGA